MAKNEKASRGIRASFSGEAGSYYILAEEAKRVIKKCRRQSFEAIASVQDQLTAYNFTKKQLLEFPDKADVIGLATEKGGKTYGYHLVFVLGPSVLRFDIGPVTEDDIIEIGELVPMN